MNMVKACQYKDLDSSIFIYNGTLYEQDISRFKITDDAQVFECMHWDLPINSSLEDLTQSFKLSHPELFV